MGRPRLSDATRQELIDVGIEKFLHKGYHGTGLQEVLDEVKVPKGSFYNYFESKEDFGRAAIRHYSDCLGSALATALADAAGPLAGVRLFFERLMVQFEKANFTGGCLVANLGAELEGSELFRHELASAFDNWRDGLRAALAKAQAQSDIRSDIDAAELSDLLIHTWEGAVIRMKVDRSLTPLKQCLRRILEDYFQAKPL